MTVVSKTVSDVAGNPDFGVWRFSTDLSLAADDTTIVSNKSVSVIPDSVNGEAVVSVDLEPGQVGVTYRGITTIIEVPETGPADLLELLDAGSFLAGGEGVAPSASYRGSPVDDVTDAGGGNAEFWVLGSSVGTMPMPGAVWSNLTGIPVSIEDRDESAANVMDHGAVGNGVADDTDAIDDAFAASYVVNQTNSIYLPAGQYVYNGDGLNGKSVLIEGAGPGRTNIYLGAGKYLTDYDAQQSRIIFKNFTLHNGAGAYRNSWTGTNVAGQYVVEDCAFYLQTECVFQHEASDMPFWKFNRCNFQMADADNTIAIALSGLTDGVEISNCTFDKQRVAIKMRQAGPNASINHCEFVQFTSVRNNGPAVSVWLVPHTSYINSGDGLDISNNRFGNENLNASDIRIAYADELAGATNGTQFPDLATDSTGFITGQSLASNDFYEGASGIPVIFSTTPTVRNLSISDNYFNSVPSYMLEFLTPVTVRDRQALNVFTGNRNLGTSTGGVYKLTNSPGMLFSDDPYGLFPNSDQASSHGNGAPGSYLELVNTDAGSFTIVSARWTKDSDDTDALGGTNAATYTASHAGADLYALALQDPEPGVPVWIEFDIANPDDGNALEHIQLAVQNSTDSQELWAREIQVPTVAQGWVSYCFSFTPNAGVLGTALFIWSNVFTGDFKSFKFGRPRLYQGHFPQQGGHRPAIAAAASDAATTQTLANDLRDKLIDLGIIEA